MPEFIPVIDSKWEKIAYRLEQANGKDPGLSREYASAQINGLINCALIAAVCTYSLKSQIASLSALVIVSAAILGYFLHNIFKIGYRDTSDGRIYTFRVWTPIFYFSSYTYGIQLAYMALMPAYTLAFFVYSWIAH